MAATARGPHFTQHALFFQALCKIDIQELGRTAYSAVPGGVNSRRAKTTTYRQHCSRFRFLSSENAYGRYTRSDTQPSLITMAGGLLIVVNACLECV